MKLIVEIVERLRKLIENAYNTIDFYVIFQFHT